jgi:hypothetical protein
VAADARIAIVNGYRARWHGSEYEASPDGEAAVRLYADGPAPGFEEIRPGRYRRLVRRDEVDWFGYARVVAAWRDLPVLVLAERGPEILVEYLDGLAPLALAAGLTRTEPGVYQGWVPRAEVQNMQEVRTP